VLKTAKTATALKNCAADMAAYTNTRSCDRGLRKQHASGLDHMRHAGTGMLVNGNADPHRVARAINGEYPPRMTFKAAGTETNVGRACLDDDEHFFPARGHAQEIRRIRSRWCRRT